MSEFIVSGIIPGTQLQITFFMWVFLTSSALAFLLGRAGYRAKLIQAWLIAGSILLAIRTNRIANK